MCSCCKERSNKKWLALLLEGPIRKLPYYYRREMRIDVLQLSPCAGDSFNACIYSSCFAANESRSRSASTSTSTTTTRAFHSDFATSTAGAIFPNTHFGNHECLPSLPDAFSGFLSAYPQYADTAAADEFRDRDYPHLHSHCCLDYTGCGLFAHSQPPVFTICYRPSVTLASQLQEASRLTPLESAVRRRLMKFINASEEEYSMVCAASRASAFKLLATSYPFESHSRLLTLYDHDNEEDIQELARGRGAKVLSASFSWPSLRIDSSKLKKILISGSAKKKKKNRGLFVFPLQSRVTGARYPYLWMKMARDNGWHVALDAGALGAKDMDTLGLSIIQPDFIICSFYNVFGADPSGFAALFVNKSGAAELLQTSPAAATGAGVVSLVPTMTVSQMSSDSSGFLTGFAVHHGETSETQNGNNSSDIGEPATSPAPLVEIEFRGLEQADSMGMVLISSRLRYITNWLVIALMKLKHLNDNAGGHPLVRIYGPKVKFDRGPAVAFNVFDWKGEKVEPALVQKLADRSNISLSCGFLKNIYFRDKYEEDKNKVLERRKRLMAYDNSNGKSGSSNRKKERVDLGIAVVNASLGFLNNFEDAYRLWAFVAKFLDADFVEKERWRYIALNQKLVEV